MKKPVAFVIALIYIFAVSVVGFLGVKAKVIDAKVYVENITLTFDQKLEKREPATGIDYYYIVPYVDNLRFDITAQVSPNDATIKECIYEIMDNNDAYYNVNVNFNGQVTIASITCKSEMVDYPGIACFIQMKVFPNDGNRQLFKVFKIGVRL